MRRLTVLICVLAVMGFGLEAWAERCIGPGEDVGFPGFGVAPLSAADIVWCDDFDSYCVDNQLADSRWPGYPPTPDNVCTTGATASGQWFRQPFHWPRPVPVGSSMNPTTIGRWEGWNGNPGWITEPFIAGYQGGGNTSQYHVFDISEAVAHKYPGSDSLNGTDENPLILRYWMYHAIGVGAAPNSPLYVELKMDDERAPTDYVTKDCQFGGYDCNCALLHPEAHCSTGVCQGPTCVDWQCMDIGAGPQCLGGPNSGMSCTSSAQCLKTCNTGGPEWPECTTNADCRECVGGAKDGESCAANADCIGCVGGTVEGSFCTNDLQCQFPCGPEDQAVCEAGPNQGQECSEDIECSAGPYLPVVVQQWLNAQIATAHPPLDAERTWASLAFGMLAQTDRNPCNLETGAKPTQYHAATFDGNRWYDLRGSVFLPGTGDFNYDEGQAYFELEIRSEVYIARLVAPAGSGSPKPVVENWATIPRQYMGPFNRIGMGTGPGCELDPVTGECLGEPGPWTYMQADSGLGWSSGWIDRLVVLGGEPSSTLGACCLPNGSCVLLTGNDCAAAGGSYNGFGTSCDDVTCCPTPFADADGDGDVDQVDFGEFQVCFSGGAETATGKCLCFDRDSDDTITQDDFNAFQACWSGPGVPLDPDCENP